MSDIHYHYHYHFKVRLYHWISYN